MNTEYYPYTNFHDLNLDWILSRMMEYAEKIDPFMEELEKVQDSINSLATTTRNMSANIQALIQSDEQQNLTDEELKARVKALEDSFDEFDHDTTALNASVASLEALTANLADKVDKNTSNINILSGTLSDVSTRLGTVSTTANETQTSLGMLRDTTMTGFQEMGDNIAKVQETVDDLSETVETVQADTKTNAENFQNLEQGFYNMATVVGRNTESIEELKAKTYREVPTGGTAGQVLTAGDDDTYGWADAPKTTGSLVSAFKYATTIGDTVSVTSEESDGAVIATEPVAVNVSTPTGKVSKILSMEDFNYEEDV